MPDDNPDIAAQLLRGQRRQTWAMILLYLIVVLAIGYVWRQQNRTHYALCTFRADLAGRVQQSEDFLRVHPDGFPGVTAAAIRAGITNQQHAIAALSSLHCADTP